MACRILLEEAAQLFVEPRVLAAQVVRRDEEDFRGDREELFLGFSRVRIEQRVFACVDAEGKPTLDIQPAKKSDKPKAEPATA